MGFRGAQTSVGTPAQLPGFRWQRHDAGGGLCVRWPSECCLGALAPWTSGVWMKHGTHGFPCYIRVTHSDGEIVKDFGKEKRVS